MRAIHELDNIQANLFREHVTVMEHFVTGTTVISVVVAHLIARIHLIGSYLDMISITPEAKRLNLDHVRVSLQTRLLDDRYPSNIKLYLLFGLDL